MKRITVGDLFPCRLAVESGMIGMAETRVVRVVEVVVVVAAAVVAQDRFRSCRLVYPWANVKTGPMNFISTPLEARTRRMHLILLEPHTYILRHLGCCKQSNLPQMPMMLGCGNR